MNLYEKLNGKEVCILGEGYVINVIGASCILRQEVDFKNKKLILKRRYTPHKADLFSIVGLLDNVKLDVRSLIIQAFLLESDLWKEGSKVQWDGGIETFSTCLDHMMVLVDRTYNELEVS